MSTVVEFHADDIDSAALARTIIGRMDRYESPISLPVSSDRLQLALDELHASMASLQVSVEVRDQKIPVGNAAWNRLKYQFHELVAIYVNELGGRQTAVNETLAELVETLLHRQAELADAHTMRIVALEREVGYLRSLAGIPAQGQE